MQKVYLLVAVTGLLASSAPAFAMNFSFTGSFPTDDTVQTFSFTVGATSAVTLETLSYAGGTNAAGTVIPRGGFDPILALFNSAGALINQNDDGASVPADPVTGQRYDTYLQSTLAAGTYTVSVMEYENFAVGPNLSNGFTRMGQGDFTSTFGCVDNQAAFNDVSGVHGCGRTANWAFDILNVAAATQSGGNTSNSVPEPASLALLGMSLIGLATVRCKRD